MNKLKSLIYPKLLYQMLIYIIYIWHQEEKSFHNTSYKFIFHLKKQVYSVSVGFSVDHGALPRWESSGRRSSDSDCYDRPAHSTRRCETRALDPRSGLLRHNGRGRRRKKRRRKVAAMPGIANYTREWLSEEIFNFSR